MNLKKLTFATLLGGFGMWVVGGLWHNLILPSINNSVEAHHEGLMIGLVAYFILAFLMAYLFLKCSKESKPVIEGLKLGIVIGIVWVFPHGLAMAGVHGTSIIYEIKNTLYHIVEQGIGGIIIGLIYGGSRLKLKK